MIIRFKHPFTNGIIPSTYIGENEKGEITKYRLVEGSEEIVESKQDKNSRPREFKIGIANTLVEGVAYYEVDITDNSVIKFLKQSPYWNVHVFEYDPIAESKEKAETMEKDVTLLSDIFKLSNEDLMAVGYDLLRNEALELGRDKNFNGLKVRVAEKAAENPDKVLACLKDKDKNERFIIGLAFARNIIQETEAGNSVSFTDNESKILSVPANTDPIDAMLAFYKEAEGKEVRKIIHQKMTAAKKPAEKVVAEKDAEK